MAIGRRRCLLMPFTKRSTRARTVRFPMAGAPPCPPAQRGQAVLDGRLDPARPAPETFCMPAPSDDVLPFRLSGGWPDALPGCGVTIRETDVVLGSLPLGDDEWRSLLSSPVLSLRIDDHPASYAWTARHPDGTESDGVRDPPGPGRPAPRCVSESTGLFRVGGGRTWGIGTPSAVG